MSDIRCVVCGESWDAWGLAHGDMLAWEVDLFRAGAGCPECEGVSNGHEISTIADIENGDGDPAERIFAREAYEQGSAPQWKEPPLFEVLWTCAACGVEVGWDRSSETYDGRKKVGAELVYNVPTNAKCRQWHHSHDFDSGVPDKNPAYKFGESGVCEFCLQYCGECDSPVCTELDHEDVYSEGWATSLPDRDCREVFCLNCVEANS